MTTHARERSRARRPAVVDLRMRETRTATGRERRTFPRVSSCSLRCGVNVRAGTTPTREPSIHPFLIASSLRCQEQDGTVTRKAHPNSHLNVGDRCAIFVTKSTRLIFENNTRYAIAVYILYWSIAQTCAQSRITLVRRALRPVGT